MNHRIRLAVGLGGLYGLLAVLFSVLGLLLWADMQEVERQAVLAIMEQRYPLAVLIILLAWLGAGEVPGPNVLYGGALVITALAVNEVIGWRQKS